MKLYEFSTLNPIFIGALLLSGSAWAMDVSECVQLGGTVECEKPDAPPPVGAFDPTLTIHANKTCSMPGGKGNNGYQSFKLTPNGVPGGVGWEGVNNALCPGEEKFSHVWARGISCGPQLVSMRAPDGQLLCYPEPVILLERHKKLGMCPIRGKNPFKGNPIEIGTGNKRQVEVDIAPSGQSQLGFVRTYNSAPYLGAGWTHTYRRSIKAHQVVSGPSRLDTVRVQRANGGGLHLSPEGKCLAIGCRCDPHPDRQSQRWLDLSQLR
ncbi:DUF6531 domain-containing protein [Chitinivorax sp. B]|uniref:DUF6531 domain-containing protein n=1 Tax=Chitinivorax sp. B TaxID=2502235 RepID=UPI00148587C0|nr:DUF6531 domain-containing protein [Chitinivorax sp. B]